MMEAVAAIPPFERFYEERRDEIFGYLARLLGRDAAEDAFQETFLRALRGYAKWSAMVSGVGPFDAESAAKGAGSDAWVLLDSSETTLGVRLSD